jgi:hypothetical protein
MIRLKNWDIGGLECKQSLTNDISFLRCPNRKVQIIQIRTNDENRDHLAFLFQCPKSVIF